MAERMMESDVGTDRPVEGRVGDKGQPEPGTHVMEGARLIASDKVEGTPVRRSNGDKLGVIRRVMIDKPSGKVAYAVMSFGGFLGIGDDYRAIPWSMLEYNERIEGYELNVTDEQLRGAPALPANWGTGAVDRGWERGLHDYYRAPPYW
jgi:hypothetical protein